ncbi:unnamed protein product, partial [Heterosigma akashiwo]
DDKLSACVSQVLQGISTSSMESILQHLNSYAPPIAKKIGHKAEARALEGQGDTARNNLREGRRSTAGGADEAAASKRDSNQKGDNQQNESGARVSQAGFPCWWTTTT